MMILSLCAALLAAPAAAAPKAPNFKVAVVRNAPVVKINGLGELKGKVVYLDFWATWCAPCREETPWFVEFQSKYRDRGFVVLGVSLDEDGWKAVKPFMESKHVNYPVVIDSSGVGDLYGVKNLPETMIIDQSGRIALNCAGLIGKDEYQTEIEGLLKGGVL